MNKVKIILFFIVALFMIQFIMQMDFSLIWQQLSKSSVGFLAIMMVTFLGYLAASYSWLLCIPRKYKIGLGTIFTLRHIGETIALLNPSNIIAGEAMKISYLKNHNIETEDAVSSILISRSVLVISSLVLLLLSTLIILIKLGSLSTVFIFGSTLIMVIVIICYTLVSKKLLLSSFYNRICNWPRLEILSNQKPKLLKINIQLSEFKDKKPITLMVVFFLSTLHWITGGIELFIIFYLLKIPMSIFDCVSMEMGVMVFKSLGSFIPGQIGVEEYGNKIMIESLGVSIAGLWITVSLLRRARQFSWIVIGIILYIYRSLVNHVSTTSISKSIKT